VAGFGVAHWLRTPSSPEQAPAHAADFDLRDLAGKTHRLADYRGKVVLVNFWATWCPPCREEIPGFIRLQTRYQSQGLQILGISLDNPEAVARYWREMKINYPLLLVEETAFQLMAAYGNPKGGLPYSALVRPDGTIAHTKLGIYREPELEKLIIPLLTQGKSANN